MTKLADAIQRSQRVEATPMGFGPARPVTKPSLLVGLTTADAGAIDGTTADVVLLDGRAAPSGDALEGARTAAGTKPLGLRVASGGAAAAAAAARAAGLDFLLIEPQTPAAALLEEELGYVLVLPAAPEELFLRSLDALNLEALYIEQVAASPTVADQIELSWIGTLGRKPLICGVAADASKEDLQALRGAGVVLLLTEGPAASVERLRETVLSLPPRRQRREDRAVVSLPRGQAAAAEPDEDDDDDD